MAHYVHHIPGRLRIKSAWLKRNEARAQRVRDLLGAIEGVNSAQANTVTGSLLISYDPDSTSPDALLQILKGAGCCAGSLVLPNRETSVADRVVDSLSGTGDAFGKAVVGVLVEKMVERSAVALIGAVL
jgi:hypothetical protein